MIHAIKLVAENKDLFQMNVCQKYMQHNLNFHDKWLQFLFSSLVNIGMFKTRNMRGVEYVERIRI
jgi:hypothetical protein